MPRVLILPRLENEEVFARILPAANSCQVDFTFHVLPPDQSSGRPTAKSSADSREILEYLSARKKELGAPPDDLLLTFYDGVLSHGAELTNLFMAGSSCDSPMPCNAVISLRFLSWDVLESRFDYELQQHALLHLVVCGLVGAYTCVQPHIDTYGCLLDFNNRLLDFNRKLQRGYYFCSPEEKDCHRKVSRSKYGGSIIRLCSTFKHGINRQALQVIIGEITMGDKYEDIRNATIINRSLVIEAFNVAKELKSQDIADALMLVAKEVERSGNHAAGHLMNCFNRELAKPTQDRNKLREFWDGLLAVLPSLADLGNAVGRIGELLAG